MLFERELREAVRKGLLQIYKVEVNPGDVAIQPTRKDFVGDLTVVTFNLAKLTGRNPEMLGKELSDWLVSNASEVSSCNVVKGFLNVGKIFVSV